MGEKCQDIFQSNTSVFTVPELKISSFPSHSLKPGWLKDLPFLVWLERVLTKNNFRNGVELIFISSGNLELLGSLRSFSQPIGSLCVQWKVQKFGSWHDMGNLVKKRCCNSTDCSKVREAGRVYLKWYNLWNIVFHFLTLKDNFCFWLKIWMHPVTIYLTSNTENHCFFWLSSPTDKILSFTLFTMAYIMKYALIFFMFSILLYFMCK